MNALGLDSGPRLGLNMHPKWLEGGPAEAFLSPLWEVGLRVLEFPMDLLVSDWVAMDELIRACRQLQFGLSFHAPYGGAYNIARFSGSEREEIEKLFTPLIDYAAALHQGDGPTTMVIHGAKGASSRQVLRAATRRFVDWMGDRAPCLKPALELRVMEPDIVKIGDRKADLLDVLARSRNPEIGICWDLGHDTINGWPDSPPGFVQRVSHVHVHDLSSAGEDHFPLLFHNVPYLDAFQKLRRFGFQGTLVLEVNGYAVVRIARERALSHAQILKGSLERIVEAFPT